MKKIKVLNNQSLFDIAIQEYGTVEAVFDLAMANGLGITDELNAGQELAVPDSDFVIPEIVAYYKKNGLHPATGSTGVIETEVPVPGGGDCEWQLINW